MSSVLTLAQQKVTVVPDAKITLTINAKPETGKEWKNAEVHSQYSAYQFYAPVSGQDGITIIAVEGKIKLVALKSRGIYGYRMTLKQPVRVNKETVIFAEGEDDDGHRVPVLFKLKPIAGGYFQVQYALVQ